MTEHATNTDTETLAVAICSHSGRHTAGDGSHAAEQWGPCSQCKHYALVVEPILAARDAAARAEEGARIVAQAERQANTRRTHVTGPPVWSVTISELRAIADTPALRAAFPGHEEETK